MESVASLTKFFSGEVASVQFPEQWGEHLRILTQGVAQRLWSEFCTDPKDDKWMAFAGHWSQLAYHNLPGWFRIFTGENSDKDFLAAEKAAVSAQAEATGQSETRIEWAIPRIGKSSRYLLTKNYQGYQVLEYSPDGKFESIPGLAEKSGTEIVVPPAVWSSEAFRTFVNLAKSKPISYPPVELLKSLATEVKASVAEVALVWFGLPNINTYSSNFMPTHLREACKLKTKECSTARDALKAMPASLLQPCVHSVVAGDPADLWEQPPVKIAARIRAAWKSEQIDRLELNADWMEKLTSTLGYHVDKHQFLQALNSPFKHPMFSDQGAWKFGKGRYSTELLCQDDRGKFDGNILQAAGNCIALLAYGLPVGDQARGKVADIHQATLKALANPELLLAAGTRYDHEVTKGPKLVEIVQSIVGTPKKQDAFEIADDGTVVVACDEHRLQIAFRPIRIMQKDQLTKLSNQLKALLGTGDQEETEIKDALLYVNLIRSDEFQELSKRTSQTPVPAGSYETNPLLSTPEIVKQLAKKLKLSDDAAAYYLQLLTLPDPTDKNITLWNGWTTAKIKSLGGELVDTQLVLEASRARAGRKLFLPGGWEDLKAPHLPIETWKMPLFQMKRDGNQRATPPLARIVPLEPVHTLFAKAWKRIVDGDVPKYEEVK